MDTHQSSTPENGENQKTPVSPLVSQGILDLTEARTVQVLGNPKNENQKNKDIVRYAFNFKGVTSGLSYKENAFIKKYLGEDAIKIRITCIRHGMSLEEEEHERIATISGIKRLISQTRGTALCEGAKKQYKETIVLELQKLGINSKNTYLFSCGETEDGAMVRVQESANILQEDLGIDENHVIGNIVGLDSTDKEDDSEPRRAARTKLHNIDFAHQLINSIKDHSIRNINILCVIHKSNIIGLGEGFLGYNITSHLSTINELKTGGIITIDIDNSGKPVNNHGNYGTLKLDNTSYGEIIAILQGEVGLQDIFTRFKNKKLQIWEVQNYVNAYFKSKRELLFEKYITSTNQNLRVFCIVNLIKNGNSNFIFEKMETIFQQEDHENKIKISKIILDTCSDGDKKHMLDYIAQIPNLVSEMKLGNLAYYANYQKYVKKNIEYIRNKTLDERFKSGENNIISLQFNDEKIKSIDDIIQQNELIIIGGESGTGKSIKLFEIMEYLKPIEDKKNKYFPIYLNLGKISFDEIPGELERQCTGLFRNGKYIFLYLFDALDESKYDNETKKEFLKYIRKLQEEGGKVILTSRPGSKPKYKETEKKEEKIYDSIKKIGLKKFSIEDIKNYIKTHLSEEKIEIWNHWVNKNTFIDDLKDSPLMLCIICNLIEFGVDTDNIKTKTDLYKKIVENRLLHWERLKNKSEVKSTNIPIRERLLSEIAYSSLIQGEKITKEFIDNIIKSNDIYPNIIPRIKDGGEEKYDLEPLNLIYKINNHKIYNEFGDFCGLNNDGGDYDFTHQSFKEYFTAKYIIEKIQKNDFDFKKFLCQDLEKIDLNFLNMFCELLNEPKNIDIKNIFIKNIKENNKEKTTADEVENYRGGYVPKINYILGILHTEEQYNFLFIGHPLSFFDDRELISSIGLLLKINYGTNKIILETIVNKLLENGISEEDYEKDYRRILWNCIKIIIDELNVEDIEETIIKILEKLNLPQNIQIKERFINSIIIDLSKRINVKNIILDNLDNLSYTKNKVELIEILISYDQKLGLEHLKKLFNNLINGESKYFIFYLKKFGVETLNGIWILKCAKILAENKIFLAKEIIVDNLDKILNIPLEKFIDNDDYKELFYTFLDVLRLYKNKEFIQENWDKYEKFGTEVYKKRLKYYIC